ncbi:protein phosphatase 2C domain-containing protein [Streptomyces actuosus]|nr:protein phosphatase 2C domain-containing protein [Streptomyces actuosus]
MFKRRRGRHAAPEEGDGGEAGAEGTHGAAVPDVFPEAAGTGPAPSDVPEPLAADSTGPPARGARATASRQGDPGHPHEENLVLRAAPGTTQPTGSLAAGPTTASPPAADAPQPVPTAGPGRPAQEPEAAVDSAPAPDGAVTCNAPGATAGSGARARGSVPEFSAATARPAAAPPRTLPTDAPRVGDPLPPLPLPRLASPTTSLPGLRADGGLLGDRWLGAASLAGQSHLNSGTTAQDAYQFTLSDDGSLLVAAVCDGLGSRPRTAQLGATLLATLLCEAGGRATAEQLAADPRAVLGDVLAAACARTARLRAAGMPGLTDKDLSCTAALVLLPAAGPGWAARVGDCAVMRLAGEAWETVFQRDGGPLNKVSAVLPHPVPAEIAEYAPLAEESPGDRLILASDGLAEDAFGSPAVRAWLAERWSQPCDAAAMADSLRYRRRGSHDDRTAVVVWSRPLRDG